MRRFDDEAVSDMFFNVSMATMLVIVFAVFIGCVLDSLTRTT